MSQLSTDLVVVEPSSADAPAAQRTRQLRSRPRKSLPTDRLKREVQLRVLEGFAKLSGTDRRYVTSENVQQTAVRDVSLNTLPLSNAFFVETGWLEKKGRGTFAATEALINYRRRAAMNPDDPRARQELRETMKDAWYWAPLRGQLEFGGSSEDDAIQILMFEANAAPEHGRQLRMLLEWVEWAGLIRRDGDRWVLADAGTPAETNDPHTDADDESGGDGGQGGSAGQADERSGPPPADLPRPQDKSRVKPAEPLRPPSVVSFAFSFDLTAEDLAKLGPEQIQAVFTSVGQVMSIRATLDK